MTRRGGRRRRRAFRRPRRIRTLQPFSIARWLNTSMYFYLDCGAGTLTAQQLHLNSAFDPMGTLSATQQPLGFDQYASLYKRTCVIAWRLAFEAVSTDNTHPVVVGFTPTTQSSALTSFSHYRELPATVQRTVTPDLDKLFFSARGGIKKWLTPRGGKILSNEDLTATTSADPNQILYGHVYAQAMDGAADPAKIHFTVKLRQLVVFFDPVVPARSTQ